MSFTDRDHYAIAYYSMSQLKEGDTLVVLKYPNNETAYDAKGFALSDIHRMHSDNLRATGSTWFTERLDDPWKNHRAAKKAGYPTMASLPEGVKYVIDVTPPDEGNEAIELTSDLYCSPGILNWYSAINRLGVSRKLVGGRDETSVGAMPLSTEPLPAPTQSPVSELSTAVSSILAGETTGVVYSGFTPDRAKLAAAGDPRESANLGTDGLRPFGDSGDNNRPLTRTVPFSDQGVDMSSTNQDERLDENKPAVKTSLDYCPTRHRTCIERLLQIIEGKDPRLDSAPKVWNVAILAAFFDCRSTVENYIVSWVLDAENSRFIEILPEATLKMAFKLQTSHLARMAYSILVSEEALRVGSDKVFKGVGPVKTPDFPKNTKTTRFSRVREDLDEDMVNLIQHAGSKLSDRVEDVLDKLLEANWLLDNVPELQHLAKFNDSLDGTTQRHNEDFLRELSFDLLRRIGHYVKGRIIHCLLVDIIPQQAAFATHHRKAENWIGGFVDDFDFAYNNLADKERMMTRPFWDIVRNMNWDFDGKIGPDEESNHVTDILPAFNQYHGRSQAIFEHHGIENVTLYGLLNQTETLNKAVAPPKSTPTVAGPSTSTTAAALDAAGINPSLIGITNRLAHLPIIEQESTSNGNDYQFTHFRDSSVRESRQFPQHLSPEDAMSASHTPTPPVSLFSYKKPVKKDPAAVFSMETCMTQVGRYIRSVCYRMLEKGENEFSTLCDTLLCLSEAEYDFLPLWAGGIEDGTGGVFAEEIPPAERGPTGPGPAFHTGSTANSVASSDFEQVGSTYSSTMQRFQTSAGVEDGFSDHVDRRVVVSEEDFPTEHGALPSRRFGAETGGAAAAVLSSGRVFTDGISSRGKYAALAAEPSVEQPQDAISAQDLPSEMDHDDFFPDDENDDGPDQEFMTDDSEESDGTMTEWEDVNVA